MTRIEAIGRFIRAWEHWDQDEGLPPLRMAESRAEMAEAFRQLAVTQSEVELGRASAYGPPAAPDPRG